MEGFMVSPEGVMTVNGRLFFFFFQSNESIEEWKLSEMKEVEASIGWI